MLPCRNDQFCNDKDDPSDLLLGNLIPRRKFFSFSSIIRPSKLYTLCPDAILLKHTPIYGRSNSIGMEGHEAKEDVGPTRAIEPVFETSSAPTVEEEKQERMLIWKIDVHILPFVVLLYLFSFLDRGT